jgi:hypothetical protein
VSYLISSFVSNDDKQRSLVLLDAIFNQCANPLIDLFSHLNLELMANPHYYKG